MARVASTFDGSRQQSGDLSPFVGVCGNFENDVHWEYLLYGELLQERTYDSRPVGHVLVTLRYIVRLHTWTFGDAEVKKYCYLPTHVAVSIWVRVRQPSMLPLVQFLNSENLNLSHASCPVS